MRTTSRVKAAGHDEQAISYTDYMGIIMGSVTDIVNTISLVLIAFVSISLVVSSIMIGIITYISVLERKKEIGILRAIGASKRNVANVFNAETFIEGLIAGVFAIVVVVLVSFPVNAWALAVKQVPNLMSLPVQGCAGTHCNFGAANGRCRPAACPQRIQEGPRRSPALRIMRQRDSPFVTLRPLRKRGLITVRQVKNSLSPLNA